MVDFISQMDNMSRIVNTEEKLYIIYNQITVTRFYIQEQNGYINIKCRTIGYSANTMKSKLMLELL